MSQKIRLYITNFVFVLGCLALYVLFPVQIEYKFEIFIASACFLCVLPILYIKLIMHGTLKDVGFTSFFLSIKAVGIVCTTIIVGGIIVFLACATGLHKSYAQLLSPAVKQQFSAFIIYEILFTAPLLFLFSFFSWGFSYILQWPYERKGSLIIATSIYAFLMIDFYKSVIVPVFFLPLFFIFYVKEKWNIFYFFLMIYLINLILDTFIIKSVM